MAIADTTSGIEVRRFETPGESEGAAWELGLDVSIASDGAARGARYIRCGASDPAAATRAFVRGIDVKPNTGYIARCKVRCELGDGQMTFAVLQPAGATFDTGNYFDEYVEKIGKDLFEHQLKFFVCRDDYLIGGNEWFDIELPFRTTADQTEISLYVGRRYGGQAIGYDAIELVEDDRVTVGEIVSGVANISATPTAEEHARGYLVSRRHWMQPVVPGYIPSREEITKEVSCWLAPGEYEPATLSLTGLRELEDVIVAMSGDLKSDDGQTLAADQIEISIIRTITRWLTNSSPVSPGQRYEKRPLFIFPNETVKLHPKETRTWWMTVKASDAQRPGVYRGNVVVHAQGVADQTIALSVEVLPIRLSQPNVTYGMYYRHSEQPTALKNEAMYFRSARDLRAHGMNSASVYAQLERKLSDGTWVTDLDHGGEDFFSLSRQMEMLTEAGLAQSGHPLLLMPSHNVSDGVRDLSNTLNYEITLPALAERRKREGWPEFLLYLFDEVGGKPDQWDALDAEMRRIAEVEKANPVSDIRLTTAAPGEKSYCYDVIIRGEAVPGKEMWTYNCSWNGSQPINDRFFAGLHTWSEGLLGNWQWCYTENRELKLTNDGEIDLGRIGAYADPWYVNYVLPSPDRNIPTIGWEGRREGVDDYRYIQTLEEAIAKADESPDAAIRAQSADARKFLDNVRSRSKVPQVVGVPMQLNSDRPYSVVMHMGLSYADYDAIRRDVADWIIRIGQ
ncbi:MAG: hypothetical protein IT582_09465 [Opitutaceae bacterium]|nr:hypothetical protein [Opitutaceae bacterium]